MVGCIANSIRISEIPSIIYYPGSRRGRGERRREVEGEIR